MPDEIVPDNNLIGETPTPEATPEAAASVPQPVEAADEPLDALAEKVLQIIADTQRKPRSSVKIGSGFEELGIDSMDGVNIVFALENEFNINVPDEEVKNIRSIRDLVEGVRKLVAEASPA